MKKLLNVIFKFSLYITVLLNCITVYVLINGINTDNLKLVSFVLVATLINFILLRKGHNINKYKKIIMILSFYGMIIVSFLGNKYINILKL